MLNEKLIERSKINNLMIHPKALNKPNPKPVDEKRSKVDEMEVKIFTKIPLN